jgi:hypothetical protein
MSKFRTSQLMLGLLILAGCQKSVTEERNEAA